MPELTPELLQLVLGLGLCLFGWLFYWGGIHVLGAVLGAALGVALGWLVVRAGELGAGVETVLAIGGALGAIAGVFLIRQLHRGFFLIVGALAGLVLGLQAVVLLREAGHAFNGIKPLGAIIGIGGGAVLFLLLSRHIIILITSFIGALLTAGAYAVSEPFLVFLASLFGGLIVQTGAVKYFGFRRWGGKDSIARKRK